VATTNYFGEITADRLKHTDNTLFFKAMARAGESWVFGQTMLNPLPAVYDAANKILTIISFDVEPGSRYLNQELEYHQTFFFR